MVKFLKPNKAVIVLQGRYAGRKAVIVKSFDEGTRDRRYGHCLVAGIKKYPSKVIRKDSAKKTAKKSRVKCFVKLVNYQHLMPTRYTLDVDLKDVVTVDALQTKDKKVAACKATKERFEERFKTGKNRWFFTKLSGKPIVRAGRAKEQYIGYTMTSDHLQKEGPIHSVLDATISAVAVVSTQILTSLLPRFQIYPVCPIDASLVPYHEFITQILDAFFVSPIHVLG
ncbi:hypothetical protein V6N13_112527 [Hibiscus sabdariffa]